MKKRIYALRESKLFYRILLCFMSLLIPIIFIGIIMYNNAVNMVQRDFADKINQNLYSSANVIDIYLKTIQETGIHFFSNNSNLAIKELVPESVMTPEQRIKQPLVIKSIQFHHNMVNEFIDNMFVYIDDSTVYTSNGRDQFDTFFGKFYPIDDYDANFWREKRQQSGMLQFLPQTKVHGKPIIPLVMKRMVNGHQAVLVMNISTEAIQRILYNNAIFSTAEFIVTNGKGEVIAASYNNSESAYSESFVASEKVVSAVYDWEYRSFTPNSELQKYTAGSLQLMITLCIVLLLVGSVAAYMYSSNLYSPIKNISNILVAQQDTSDVIEEKRYMNELDFIDRKIHHLLQINLDSNKQAKRISDDYLNHSFLNLIHGIHEKQEESLSHILHNDYGFLAEGYLCCIISFEFSEEYHRQFPELDLLVMSEKLKLIVSDMLERNVRHYLIDLKEQYFVVIANVTDEAEKQKLVYSLQTIAATFEHDTAYIDVVMSIGKVYQRLRDVTKSYDEAVTILSKYEKNSRAKITDAEYFTFANHFHFSFVEQNKLFNSLKIGDLESAEKIIKEIVYKNKKQNVSRQDMLLLFSELYQTGKRFAVEQGLDMKATVTEIERDKFYGRNAENVSDNWKISFLIQYYHKIIQLVHIVEEDRGYSLVSNIIAYIEQNIDQELYLDIIAAEVDLSAKHISRVFKEKTGVNITDYIGMTRMEIAKRLLRETNLKIYQIAKQVGITSRTTFVRTFKKFEGITPQEFRDRI